MKMGIRSKLLVTYILAIVIPVGLTLTLITAVSAYFNSREDMKSAGDLGFTSANSTAGLIRDNFQYINSYDVFYEKVMKEFKGGKSHIVIVDNNDRIIFDSDSSKESLSRKHYILPEVPYMDGEFTYQNRQMVRFVLPVVVDKTVEGKAELVLDRFPDQVIEEVLKFILAIIVLGIAVLIFLILLFTWMVSRGVLTPLKELGEAAENIAEGNLDASITYKRNDELGRFCRVFDTMRVRLKQSLEKQKEYEDARKELVASISHDLRTPITSIKGYVEAIQDGVVYDEEMLKKYLEIIKDKTDKLDRLIEDLFQFSQLEIGKLKMEMRRANSRDMIENALQGYFLEFHEMGIDMSVEEPVPSVDLNVDEYFIGRVFDNILQNAKRYVGPGGRVRIGSSIQDGYFQVAIRDNGKGIRSEDLPHIFNRFYRGEKSRSREYGGAGLGLSICKQIIEGHGGRIWVESIIGKGSTFCFTLPVMKQ